MLYAYLSPIAAAADAVDLCEGAAEMPVYDPHPRIFPGTDIYFMKIYRLIITEFTTGALCFWRQRLQRRQTMN